MALSRQQLRRRGALELRRSMSHRQALTILAAQPRAAMPRDPRAETTSLRGGSPVREPPLFREPPPNNMSQRRSDTPLRPLPLFHDDEAGEPMVGWSRHDGVSSDSDDAPPPPPTPAALRYGDTQKIHSVVPPGVEERTTEGIATRAASDLPRPRAATMHQVTQQLSGPMHQALAKFHELDIDNSGQDPERTLLFYKAVHQVHCCWQLRWAR